MGITKKLLLLTLVSIFNLQVSWAQYSGVFLKDDAQHRLWRNANWSSFTDRWQRNAEDGFKLTDLEINEGENGPLYSGVFRAQTGGYGLFRIRGWDNFRTKWRTLAGEGYRLIDYEYGGGYHTGVWVGGSGTYALSRSNSWSEFLVKNAEQEALGLRLVDYENVNSFHLGVWREDTVDQQITRSASWSAFREKAREMNQSGYRLIDYERNSGYHTGVWRESDAAHGLWVNTSWASLINRRNIWAQNDIQIVDLEIDESDRPPHISVESIYPMEGRHLIYQKLAPQESGLPVQAQITIDLVMKNLTSTNKQIDRVRLTYGGSGNYAPVTLRNDLKIRIGSSVHQISDTIDIPSGQQFTLMLLMNPLLPKPWPQNVKIQVYFKGHSKPVTISRLLKAHRNAPLQGSYLFPAKIQDLAVGEYWTGNSSSGKSHHRTSTRQFYAHDMGVRKWDADKNDWSEKFPGKDGSQNDHYRVWGVPIYAMADGVVQSWEDGNVDHLPRTPRSEQSRPNFFIIKHGDETAYYYHLKNGSLNEDLMERGGVVKAGQYLGRVGNSGRSSHPHLHIDVRKDGAGRPIHFRNTYVVRRSLVPDGKASEAKWAKVSNQGLPISGNIVWPSKHKPFAVPGRFTGVWRAGDNKQAIWVGATWQHFYNKWQEFHTQGLRLIDIETYKENGVRKYHGVWKEDSGQQFLWVGATWDSFKGKAAQLETQDMRLVDMETFEVDGERRYIGLWRNGTYRHALWVGANWISFRQKAAQFANQNLRLIDMETYIVNGRRRYLGIWKAGSDGHGLWVGDDWNGFKAQWQNLSSNNLRLIDMETYMVGNSRKYLGVFRAGNDKHFLWNGANWNEFLKKYESRQSKGFQLIDLEIHYNNQIQERKAPEITELENSANLKAYPNPFTSTTHIEFNIPEDAQVSLTIFNLMGQIVAQPIIKQQRAAGKYKIDFQANNLRSGIYFSTLIIGEQKFTQKLILVKDGNN